MAQIINSFCESCVKASVCEWSQKLYKLEGTEKKPGILDIKIHGCGQYLSLDGETEEDIEEIEDIVDEDDIEDSDGE